MGFGPANERQLSQARSAAYIAIPLKYNSSSNADTATLDAHQQTGIEGIRQCH